MPDLTITATDIQPGNAAAIRSAIAGTAITAGQPIYVDDSDNRRLKLADSSAKESHHFSSGDDVLNDDMFPELFRAAYSACASS